MQKKKLLIVTQEMQPYTALSEISEIALQLPTYAQTKGMEIRVLMPRYGTINERRHRLHEVVRLSGMNIIIDDDDYPLIIKVASLPNSRMQVYFLDNEDFFRRKSVYEDSEGKPFDDNPDRMVFFCKGVLETVKKFGWAPDIIHCHGWMTSLIPLYLRNAYSVDPIFKNAKVIYSAYEIPFGLQFSEKFIDKASINNLDADDLKPYHRDGEFTLHQGAATYADGIIIGSERVDEAVVSELKLSMDKPVLDYMSGADAMPAYMELYHNAWEAEVKE